VSGRSDDQLRVGTAGRTLAHLGATALVRAGVVLAGFTVAAGVAGVAWGAQDVALSMAGPEGGDPITIEGNISGVVAGAPSAPLRLTLRNPGNDARTVTRVRADSTGVPAGPAACDAARLLSVGEWHGTVTVPARGTAHVTLPVAVAVALPAECAGLAWGLVYTAY
jgi:hypothetical protein